MKRAIWGIVLLVLGLSGCSAHNTTPSANELLIIPGTSGKSAATSTVAPSTPPSETAAVPGGKMSADVPNVGAAVKQLVKSATTAAVVVDRVKHETLISENGDRPFISGSLVKVMIGIDAMRTHPRDDLVAKRVYTMIQFSDDSLASSFWGSEGGASIINRIRALIGLRGTRPPTPANMWGWTMITANDLVRVYDYLLDQAPDRTRDTILDAMANAAEKGSDGFYQHFGIPDGLGADRVEDLDTTSVGFECGGQVRHDGRHVVQQLDQIVMACHVSAP
ncbi:hypothetical protein ACFQ1S_18915, partial [Kibdelosporangium lantanae]